MINIYLGFLALWSHIRNLLCQLPPNQLQKDKYVRCFAISIVNLIPWDDVLTLVRSRGFPWRRAGWMLFEFQLQEKCVPYDASGMADWRIPKSLWHHPPQGWNNMYVQWWTDMIHGFLSPRVSPFHLLNPSNALLMQWILSSQNKVLAGAREL